MFDETELPKCQGHQTKFFQVFPWVQGILQITLKIVLIFNFESSCHSFGLKITEYNQVTLGEGNMGIGISIE